MKFFIAMFLLVGITYGADTPASAVDIVAQIDEHGYAVAKLPCPVYQIKLVQKNDKDAKAFERIVRTGELSQTDDSVTYYVGKNSIPGGMGGYVMCKPNANVVMVNVIFAHEQPKSINQKIIDSQMKPMNDAIKNGAL